MLTNRHLFLGLVSLALSICSCHGGFEDRDRDAAPDGRAPCSGIDCSGHGDCVEREGHLLCDCDDGYYPDGLACIAWPDGDADADVDGDADGDGDGDGDADSDSDADADSDADSDVCVPSAELCNGIDDDCDPTTPDGTDDPAVGVPCDGSDSDACEEGETTCSDSGIGCSDSTGDSAEVCNGLDDDCDGDIDVGAGCPCNLELYRGHAYLFCSEVRTWLEAFTYCGGFDYTLVTIDNRAENGFVESTARSHWDDDAWIGLNDLADEGVYLWMATRLEPTYVNWGVGEPNGSGDCCEIEDDGYWNDKECDTLSPFICEAE